MGEIIDKVKEKTKDVKDAVVDTTKNAAEMTKDTVDPSSTANSHSLNVGDRKYEEGGPGTDVNRNDNPLTEYREKEPMTPSKINEHEPTAVKRDSRDQTITSEGQTGTRTPEAQEEYRKRGMTKIESDDSQS